MQREFFSNEDLVENIRSGKDAEESMLQLWQQNQGIIHKLAKKYSCCSSAEYDDLVQEGFLGVYEAVIHYNSNKQASFFSYAVYWIKQFMIKYCQNNECTVQIPPNAKAQLTGYNQFVNLFFQNNGRNPTDAEICHHLGINEENLRSIRKTARMTQIASLSEPVNEEGVLLGELIPGVDDVEETVLDSVEQKELQEILWGLVDKLPEQQNRIINLRYKHRATIQHTSNALGVPYHRVRSVEQEALRVLRKPSNRRKLEPFLPDAVAARAYRGSVKSFNRTWTSATEGAALKLIGQE